MNTKKILLYTICILCSLSLLGKERKGIAIDSILDFASCGERISIDSISRTIDSVRFYMSFDFQYVEIKSCGSIDFIPVWSYDTLEMILPFITLRGRRAQKLFHRDSILDYSRSTVDTTSRLEVYTHISHWDENPREVEYLHTVAYETWMDSARVYVVKRHYECGRANFTLGVLHSPLRLEPLPSIFHTPDTSNAIIDLEIEIVNFADSLAALNNFMHPMANYASDKAYGFHMDDKGSLFIHFHYKRTNIDPIYMNNQESLDNLCTSINILLANKDVEGIKLTLAGFASPEGSLALNTRLAQARVEDLSAYLMRHTNINVIDIEIYNGAENWQGLRDLVVSSTAISNKAQILDIIDNVPIKHGREKKLMDLNGGNTYRYMLKHLFPTLRQAGYIRLYYENKR